MVFKVCIREEFPKQVYRIGFTLEPTGFIPRLNYEKFEMIRLKERDHTFLLFSLSSKEIVLDTTNATQLKGFIISNLVIAKLKSNWLA